MVHPEDKDFVLQYTEARTRNATVTPIVHRIIHKDGSIRWITDHATLSFDTAGNVIRIDGLIQDITDKKIAETIIQESEEKYRILFENAIEGMFITNEYGNIIEVNPSGWNMLDYNYEELKNFNFFDLIYKFNGHSTSIDLKNKITNLEISLVTKSGRRIYVNLNSVPIKVSNFYRNLFVLRDITERKEFEKALYDSEQNYRTIFDTTPESILILSLVNNDILAANQKFLELFSSSFNEVIGKKVYDVIYWSIEENRSKFYELLYKEKEIHNFRTTLIDKNNIEIECLISARIITYAKEPACLVIVQDMTKILKTEETLVLLDNAFEQSVEIVMITDVSGNIQYVNSAFERINRLFERICHRKKTQYLEIR